MLTCLPSIAEGNNAWRWTLNLRSDSCLPVIVIRPFLPESPAWKEKKEKGTLKRPSFGEPSAHLPPYHTGYDCHVRLQLWRRRSGRFN